MIDIAMQHVESSNLDAIGYDLGSKTLRVAFRNGGVYDYSDVPEEVFTTLGRAESVGGSFHKLVKAAGYKYERRN